MQEAKSDLPSAPVESMPVIPAPERHTPAAKPELRPEIREIVERNWKRNEEALRYLGK